jgi:hypothetical protein
MDMIRRRRIIAPEEPEAGASARGFHSNLHDLRFSALLGPAQWARLPAAVRARFSKRLEAGAAVTYAGTIVYARRTLLGKLLSRLCIAIGAPLPLDDETGVPAVVTVTEDSAGRGGSSGPACMAAHAASPRSFTAASVSPGRPGWRNISVAASASR